MKKLLSLTLSIFIILTAFMSSCSPNEDKDSTEQNEGVNEADDLPPPEDVGGNDEDDTNDGNGGLSIGDINDEPPPSVDFDDLQ